MTWKCQNGQQYPIDFETEHWRLNLSYTLSKNDVAPPIPKLTSQVFSDCFENWINSNKKGTSSKTYYGAGGYVGGFVNNAYYTNTGEGSISPLGTCLKCVDECDQSLLVKNCEQYSFEDEYGGLHTGCGIRYSNGGGFGNGSLPYWLKVNCGDCCFETVSTINDIVNYETDEYHACDKCNFGQENKGGGLYPTGCYYIGVDTVEGFTAGFPPSEYGIITTDISLRDGASWTFDFIPSYEGHESKLTIELLSCSFGCNNWGQKLGDPFGYYTPSASSVPPYKTTSNIEIGYQNISYFPDPPYQACDGCINPNLVNLVCATGSQYYNPPYWATPVCNTPNGLDCDAGCGFNGCQDGTPVTIVGGTAPYPLFGGNPNKFILTECGCTCGEVGSCHRWFHLYGNPDRALRPHQLEIELGIGYNGKAPCGEDIVMEFYEELYKTNLFTSEETKIEKIKTSDTDVRYTNPEWISGVAQAGSFDGLDFENVYNYYSQGMRMRMLYTRNSIPYEKYNHNNTEEPNCVPETIVGDITDYPALNKPYVNYPFPEHPNYSEHPNGIYEGEYALSKLTVWSPTVNRTYEMFNTNLCGFTAGTPQSQGAPVDTTSFNKCYPFDLPGPNFVYVYPMLVDDSYYAIPVDNPNHIQGTPLTYQYTYGDLTAKVKQL